MARDIKRIDRMLAMLRTEWLKSPDQRFTQLICNITDGKMCDEDYYTEDTVLESCLMALAGKSEEEITAHVRQEEEKALAAWSDFMKKGVADHIIRKRSRKEK